MKKTLLIFGAILFMSIVSFAQLDPVASFNIADLPSMADTLKPYFSDQGARSVWVAEDDLDQDGNPEILITDYSNKGRVHVLELNGGTLELVWSSPINDQGGGSTPRWVRTGDLDGDGLGEIIWPHSGNAAEDVRIRVFEWDGSTDNGYVEAIDLLTDAFSSQGVGNFRMNREVADVYDYDGDGQDELITANRDNRVYVLGISGDIPGFGGWQLEGGDPATIPKIGAGSQWHSVPADLNGDGDIEIVNHFWNYFGFYSINPTGPDTYVYPDTSQANEYIEFLRTAGLDAVAYMGIQPVDVDGDGSDEIAAIQYVGGNEEDYDLYLVDFASTDDELYGWDSTNFGKIAENAWEDVGAESGSFWGIGAADLNGNGRTEILLGGTGSFTITAVEYNGTGDLLDMNNYTTTSYYGGPSERTFELTTISDSAGVIDTTYAESPFVSKIYAGSDLNDNGKLEVVAAYQSVYDSVRIQYRHFEGIAYVTDSTVTVFNPNQINVRVLEYTVTGIKEIAGGIVTPEDYKLEQNYPNPFNPTTNIQFTLPVDKKISLKVYDVLGNEIRTLIANEEFAKGSYEATWDGTNNFGQSVASGQYIYTLKYGNFSKSMKMTLLK